MSLRARLTPCVASHKFKQTLPQNSSKSLNFVIPTHLVILTCLCHTLLFSCHTERSEVSINLKRFKRLLKVFRLNRRFKLNSHQNKVSKLLQRRPPRVKLEIKIFVRLTQSATFAFTLCFCGKV